MSKKKKHEEHENHERWLVSYADFITLLFAFFVVLYAVSRTDSARMAQVVQSIKWALHFEGNGGVGEMPIFEGPPSEGGCATQMGTSPKSTPQSKKLLEEYRRKLERRLKPFLLENQKNLTVVVSVENGRLTIRMAAMNFFDPSSALLRPEAMPVLDAIAVELAAMRRVIRIEGHTDDIQISTPRFRNNWDLSAARAATVTSYLEGAHNIAPDLLVASGMGASRPLVPNDSPENREQNRRIDLVVEMRSTDAMNVAVR